MSPAIDLDALQPPDEEREARRRALVAELAASPQAASERGTPRVSRRAFVRGGLAVTGAAAAGFVGFGVVPALRGSSVDILASARAAASAPVGGILHLVVRYEHGPGIFETPLYHDERRPGKGFEVLGRRTGRSERWIAESPVRQRTVDYVDLVGSTAVGRQEYSRGPRDERMHDSWEDFVSVRPLDAQLQARWERARRRNRRRFSGPLDQSGDPFEAVRQLLRAGRLRAVGTTELDGRAVARLVGRAPSYVDAGGTTAQPVDYEYLVDAETFVPVRITSTQVLPARPHAEEPAARHVRRLVQRWTFERFERLPLTPTTEHLLTVDTTGLRVVRPRPPKARPGP
jgi:hypothetical protein